MAKFKKGDKVRRIIDSFWLAKEGEVYEIAGVGPRGDVHLVGHKGTYGRPASYSPDKFELVQEKPREFAYRTKFIKSGPRFASLEEVEKYLCENAGSDTDIQIVEIVPVKTVRVRRVVEEVQQ